MKKLFIFLGIALLVVVGTAVLMFIKAGLTPAAPENYTETVKAGGNAESTYLKNGKHAAAYYELQVDEDYKKYEVWYPADMADDNRSYPLIVVLNGTGVKASSYKAQFKHFASWGFIVVGTEEVESWDGIAADRSLAFILEENENPSSIFYHKTDVNKIGVMGHSQGGAGVFNAITEHEHSEAYKTAVTVSPTNEKQALSLGWHYDLSKVGIPIFLVAGSKGDFEMELVIPEAEMKEMYNKLSVPKAMARKADCEHGEMLYSADGYVTAWFMWQLQGDGEAAKVFTGEDPELLKNPLYIGQRIDLGNENIG